MKSEWKDRLEHWIRTLKADFYEPLGEISWSCFHTMEHLTPQEARQKALIPVKKGYTWGNTWEYAWFYADIRLPKNAQGERIVLNLSPDGESTLFVNGKAFGTYRADWIKKEHAHHYYVDNVLTESAKGGDAFEILMETYAGHYYSESPSGGCATGPVLEGYYKDILEEGRRRTLGSCTYGIWNEAAYQLYMDIITLQQLLSILPKESLRRVKVEEALEYFTLCVDFEQDRKKRIRDYIKAREAAAPAMKAVNGTTMPKFYAVGNAHIDLAWLWPMAETHRKTARTFAAQLRLIEEYPDYKFIQSQPAAYEMCRTYYPELFERIRLAVQNGQWIADGAMWVEPDTNMAGQEALVRQLLYGKKYYKDMFGVNSEVLWLPDTFGYSAALPQILKGCNVNYLVTQKIFWSYNEGEKFPYHYFNWEGMDGSQVVSFLPTSYTYRTEVNEVNEVWKNRTQERDLEAFLYPFGYGDGGGGPARDYVESVIRQENLEGAVRMHMAGPKEFFEDMEALGGPKHTYVGELYFSAHRGTYTSQAAVKKNNRKCELALREMEFAGAVAEMNGFPYDQKKAELLWKELLLNQFHDILPGSSIARVYTEAEAQVTKAINEARRMSDDLYESILSEGEGLTIFNSLSFERIECVELPDKYQVGAMLADHTELPLFIQENRIFAQVTLPSCGSVTIYPVTDRGDTLIPEAEGAFVREENGVFCMENRWIKAVINRSGLIQSFVLKESGREFSDGSMNRFMMFKDVPRLFDAWDIDSCYLEQEIAPCLEANVQILLSGGAAAELLVTGKFASDEEAGDEPSLFHQIIRLEASKKRIIFDTTIDWHEMHRLLKVSFPVRVRAENAINEIQFGYIERPTHRSRDYDKDRFEVCNHRYTALADGAHGAAILNDSKYGISMNKNALELTLLRASTCPEMRADNRQHRFTYAFTAWEGNFANCDVVRQGYEVNVAPVILPGVQTDFSAVRIEKSNIILDTMKAAEDGSGDIIMRFYESKKAAVSTKIHFGFDCRKITVCNLLEEALSENSNTLFDSAATGQTVTLDFNAFEIKTLRIQR